MNKTPKLRFKEFSGDWESKKLGNVAQIVGGGTPSTTESEYWSGYIPWFTPTEIKSQKFVSMSERTITEVGLKKSSAKILPKGTVLLTTRASLGDMAIASNEVTTNQGFQSIIAGNDINNEFIYYLQAKLKKYCYKNASGSTFLEISKSNIEQFKFNMPLKEEQEKIASFFSLIDDKISLQGDKVEALKDYKKGMMQKIFSRELRFKDDDGIDYPEWEEKKLSELVMFTNGKAHENCIDEFGDYVVVNSKFISSDANVAKLSNENLCPLKRDDIVMVMSDVPNGKALAKCYLIDKDNKYTLNQRICGLRSTGADYKFLYYSINRNKYYLKFDNGVGQTNLRKDEVLECPILLPCKVEQEKIGSLLFDLDIKLEKEQEKLDNLNEYKKGLLQQMFV